MLRRALFTALLAALPFGAIAQEDRPTLLDVISPDRIIRYIAQSGIMSLRTFVDVKYNDMSVDFAAGRLVLTDVQIWPLPDWDDGGDCHIEAERLTLTTSALDEVDRLRMRLHGSVIFVNPACVPPGQRQVFDLLGLEQLIIPRLSVDLDYHIPGSGATILAYGTVQDVGAVEMKMNASYVWIDGRDDIDNPEPVVFLQNASVLVDNLGVWDSVKGLMPPAISDPATAGQMAQMFGEGFLSEINDGPNAPDAETEEAQAAFLASVSDAWTSFVQNPSRLVIETTHAGDVYLDPEVLTETPAAIFAMLQPRVGTRPAVQANVLPATLLQAAMTGAELSPEDQMRAGVALATGEGAPRNVALAVGMLRPLAEAGDGFAAFEAARALENRAPQDAYRFALIAGREDIIGATALLDRIESDLGLSAVLALQEEVRPLAAPGDGDLEQPYIVRDGAAQALSGNGASRSYAAAAMWAMIGRAAGDTETGAILDEIDARMDWQTGTGASAWAEAETRASQLATEAWMSANMPALLGAD